MHRRPRRRHRGQSLVEFALVTPILLLIFAGAADLGRAFYAYVAIENAAKEGALFGSRIPLCDDAGAGCANPNNVVWHVRNELEDQGVHNPNGSPLTPTVQCLAPNGSARNLRDCAEGDTYEVGLSYPFRLLTPILGSVVGDLDLRSVSRAVVLNLAFDPSPGASIQKLVSPNGAINASDIIAKCLERQHGSHQPDGRQRLRFAWLHGMLLAVEPRGRRVAPVRLHEDRAKHLRLGQQHRLREHRHVRHGADASRHGRRDRHRRATAGPPPDPQVGELVPRGRRR
jgi:hypothetical protein